MLNAFQKTAARAYGDGDYAHIADIATTQEADAEIEDCGDTLFRFVMVELRSSEDCDSKEEALRRLEKAIADIQGVIHAIETEL